MDFGSTHLDWMPAPLLIGWIRLNIICKEKLLMPTFQEYSKEIHKADGDNTAHVLIK